MTPESVPAAGPMIKPPVGVKFAYALGQVVQSAGFDAALLFVFFYYTAVLGLSGAMAGLAMAISLCVDAVVDPVIGSWSDNSRSRWGRRLPVMVVAIPAVVLGFGLLFTPPEGLGQLALFAWLTVMAIGARAAVSLFNVPYIALGAELAEGYVERSKVVVWRTVAGLFSQVFIIVLAYSVFFAGEGGLERREGYPGFGWSVAVILAIGAALCCVGVARYAARLPQAATEATPMLRRLPGELAEMFGNPSFRILFGACLVILVAIGINATFNTHVNIYVWKLTPGHIQLLTFGLLAGTLIGVPMVPVLSRLWEKRTVVMIGVMMLNLVWLVLPMLRATGVYAPTGDGAIPALMAMMLFAGVGVGMTLVAFPAMMADAADEHELLFGRRREGLYFSGLTFAAKAASGLGMLAAGLALDLVGMPRDAIHGVAVAEPALVRLVLAWGPLATVISTAGVALLWPYAISRSAHDAITEQLHARRTASAMAE